MHRKLSLIVLAFGAFLFANAQVTELTNKFAVPFEFNVKTWKNVNVAQVLMDMYYPVGAQSNQKYPAVIMLHGGSFSGGSRVDVSDACDLLAAEGFVAIAIDYRLGYTDNSNIDCGADTTSQKKAIYRAMQDVNAAFRFINANANAYNIDTSKLFIAGASAGADLGNDAAYIDDSIAAIVYPGFAAQLGTLQTSGNSYPANYTIKGICNMWGSLPAQTPIISASYRAYPMIMFKGGLDATLPDGVGHASNCPNYPMIVSGTGIYNVLRSLNVPAVYHFQPIAGHACFELVFCVRNTGCFFRSLMNNTPYSGYYTYFNNSCQ